VEVYIQNFFTSINNSDSLTATQSILKYRITNVFKADIEFDLWKFTLGYSAEYNSYINRIDAEFETFLPGFADYRELNDKGIWRMDARLAFRISKASQVTFIAKNFMNEFYSVRPGIMEAPRNFTIQYTLKI
jgi:iron complex outermembrane receptor protein